MDQKIKQEWVTALRSGKYEQGIEYLCVNDRFCCLGVLCDLAEQKGIGKWKQGQTQYKRHFTTERGRRDDDSLIPLDVAEWADLPMLGLKTKLPKTVYKGEVAYHDLEGLNDSGLFSFAEIADVIEEQL